jgi:hypothetical protein
MSEPQRPLTPSERLAATQSLAVLNARLKEAGELLAAVHIEHALQCLDPDDPINNQTAARG